MSVERVVQALTDQGAEFIIIGGWSAVLHGSVRVTNDIDFFISRAPDNLPRIVKALAPFRPRLRDLPPTLPFVWDEVTLRNSTVLTLWTDLGAVDILAEVAGLGPFVEVRATAVEVDAFDRTVLTLDLETLIRSKQAAGREKDIAAIRELEQLRDAESG
jgi:predicted nucleotidyltransferase